MRLSTFCGLHRDTEQYQYGGGSRLTGRGDIINGPKYKLLDLLSRTFTQFGIPGVVSLYLTIGQALPKMCSFGYIL
jgi:hypothetical protein